MRWLFLGLWVVGCESVDPKEEAVPSEICDNLEDDDLDDLADCADPDCAALCGEVCTNGTDDDLDGLIDCLDDDCDGLCPENCGDGRDNDADGAIDCDDRDCFGSCPEVCGDGFDNDGDGKVDCLDEECVDPSCDEICSDGRDNDADALIDCDDDDCNDPSCIENCTDGRDNDADGRVDCDDTDCDGACPEVCTDGRDNDADGRVDCEDDECAAVCDADGDGFYNADYGGDDCDDTRFEVNPSRPEVCNGDEVLDDDCDGLFDEDDPDIDPLTLIAWARDEDGDGFGTLRDAMLACQAPAGFGFADTDCDDDRADINPSMPEICNVDEPVDDDCDGLVDDEDPDVTEDSYLEWYADRDGDGFGADDDFEYACSRPDGTAASSDDCDDADPEVGPPSLWYEDSDRDGFGAGDPLDPTPSCFWPDPRARPDWIGLDCGPDDPTIYPGAEDVCEDGIDQDCDGVDAPCSGPGGCPTLDPGSCAFAAPSYVSDLYLSPSTGCTPMNIAFDGTYYYGYSGGTPSCELHRWDDSGTFLDEHVPGIDGRSVITQVGCAGPLMLNAYNDRTIYVETSPESYSPSFDLSGGTIDSQSVLGYDQVRDLFVSQAYSGLTVDRWRSDGSHDGTLVLTGGGAHGTYASAVTNNGCYLTFSAGTLYSFDGDSGAFVDSTSLVGVSSANYSFGYANGRVFVNDGGGWRGYSIGM